MLLPQPESHYRNEKEQQQQRFFLGVLLQAYMQDEHDQKIFFNYSKPSLSLWKTLVSGIVCRVEKSVYTPLLGCAQVGRRHYRHFGASADEKLS